jgi:hypothetical protein
MKAWDDEGMKSAQAAKSNGCVFCFVFFFRIFCVVDAVSTAGKGEKL